MPRELSLAEIFQLGYYWETKVLLTSVKLDVFSALGSKGLPVSELAQRLGVHAESLELLANALVAMRLLYKEGSIYGNSRVATTHLVRNSPEYVGHLLLLHDSEWSNWGKLEEVVRTGRSPVSAHVFETDPELGVSVLTVLDRIGQQSGPSLARRLQLDWARSMLDLGGGAGTNAIAFCKAYPQLVACVFDLPQTLSTTARVVKESVLDSRISLQAGDFNTDALGSAYDVILMSDILHYQGPGQNRSLVEKAYKHLNPGGVLVIKDRFLDEARTGPAWVTAFAVHIMVNTEHGRCYTTGEAMNWMKESGFERVEELEQSAVVRGFKSVKASQTHG